jgi:hypothetical protein
MRGGEQRELLLEVQQPYIPQYRPVANVSYLALKIKGGRKN